MLPQSGFAEAHGFFIQNNPPWGLDRIDGEDDDKYECSCTGSSVTVYVLDTGINAGHVDFGGRASLGPSFIPLEPTADDLNG